jgi:CBS domain-containing protein
MTPDPSCGTKDTALTDIARIMQREDAGVVPIIDQYPGGLLTGMVTDRDIVLRTLADGKDPFQMAAGDIMTTPAVFVAPDDDLDKVVRIMQDRQIRRVPVVDQSGRCCGIVSQGDLAQKGSEQQAARVVKKVSEPAVVG